MRTLKVVLALALVTMLTTGLFAQEKKKKKGQGGKLHPFAMAMMKFEKTHDALMKVELTEKQKEQLEKLHESMNPKLAGVMKKVTELIGEEKMKMAGETAKKAKEAGKSPRQVQSEIQKSLKLSEEQSEKLTAMAKDVNKLYRGMMKEVNNMLTDEQKEALKKAMGPSKRGGKKKKKDK